MGIFERSDGERRVVGGYQFREAAADTKQFDHEAAGLAELPPKVDLRPWMTTVEDQRQTNSCSANATAGAYEYLMKRHLGDAGYDVSRMFMYYNGRAAAGDSEIADEGAPLGAVIDSLREAGACAETTWPFVEQRVNDEPSEAAFSEASEFLVEDVHQIPTELAAWKTALALGNPIIFGISLFDSFDKQRKPGLVPAPTPAESARESHGGHAMLCVGYSDADKVFIVRNSWGTSWGDKGYCYMPYAYVMNEEHNFGDSWTIHRLAGMPGHDEAWGDDTSVLEDVSSFLGELDDEGYQQLLDAMGEHHFETRLALLFLHVVDADGDSSDEELAVAAEYLAPVLHQLGIKRDAGRVLRHSARLVADEPLLDETITLFGEVFPAEVLAAIANQLTDAAAVDAEADEEAELLDAIVEAWQLETE